MSSLLTPPAAGWTATDLARRFGPMPLWRFVFDPPPGEATKTRTAEVYTAVDRRHWIAQDGVFTGDPVLPGLTIPLAAVFDVDGPI